MKGWVRVFLQFTSLLGAFVSPVTLVLESQTICRVHCCFQHFICEDERSCWMLVTLYKAQLVIHELQHKPLAICPSCYLQI